MIYKYTFLSCLKNLRIFNIKFGNKTKTFHKIFLTVKQINKLKIIGNKIRKSFHFTCETYKYNHKIFFSNALDIQNIGSHYYKSLVLLKIYSF